MINKVLLVVCLYFNEIDYIEVYGIVIKFGDLVEVNVIVEVFSRDWEGWEFLFVGFVKFNFGYM